MSEKNLLILYGSETGTAQDVAERIWRESRCLQFKGQVLAMDDYDVTQLVSEELVIFVCSTTGQGEHPSNTKNFWRFLLKRSLPPTSLIKVKFGVLGLGDSSYLKYNHAAKKLYRRLLNLGGRAVVNLGLADDQHDLGIDGVVDPWIDELWKALAPMYDIPDSALPVSSKGLPPPRWDVETVASEASTFLNFPVGEPRQRHTVKVLENKRTTTPEHFQEVHLLRLGAVDDKERLYYNWGDVVMVRPQNRRQVVNHLVSLLVKDPTTVLRVVQRDPDMPLPLALISPLSLYTLAISYWDLNAVPRRYVFELLGKLTPSEMEREKLMELASTQEELFSYCNRPKRTVVEVLADFPHAAANIPLPYLFEIFQPIRPRSFSIASSHLVHHGEIHLLVAVVNYSTKLFVPRIGLCSNWLASLADNQTLNIAIKQGTLDFPRPPYHRQTIPVVMVGPGTGVAPFRGYILDMMLPFTIPKPDLTLVFGCRNREGDFHFKEDWQRTNHLRLFTAFSRDQPHKIYVQHVIVQEGQLFANLIYDKEAIVMVAGNSKNMPEAVEAAFIKVLVDHSGLSEDQAKGYIEMMQKQGRYQTETWS